MWNLVQNDPLSRPNLTAHCQSLSLCPLRHHHHNHLINHNVQHLVKHLVHPNHLVQLNHHVRLNHLLQLTTMYNFSTPITLSDNPYDQLVHLLNI